MNLGKVIGTIWATRKDENLSGAKMQILQPLDHHQNKVGEPIVAVDTIGAGPGETVFYITAREAVLPYFRSMAPIDASIIGIVDTIESYA
jgi:ethanolamine utilization protein EutN